MLFLIKVAQKGDKAWEAQHVLLATTRVHLKQTLQNQLSSEDSRGAGYLCNYSRTLAWGLYTDQQDHSTTS